MTKSINLQKTGDTYELQKYSLTPEAVEKMAEEYMTLKVPEGDTKAYKTAREALTICVKARTGTEKRRLEINKSANDFIKKNNSDVKSLLSQLQPVEVHLKSELQAEDHRKAAIKAEKERKEQERVDYIKECIGYIRECSCFLDSLDTRSLQDEFNRVNLFSISEEDYQEFTDEATKAHIGALNIIESALGARIKRDKEDDERKAEAERLEKIKKEQEKEAARLKKIEEDQKEKERIAQEKIDADRRKIEVEKAAIAAEKKAEQERKDREEFEKKTAEDARIKAEKEAKENAEAEERSRIDKEKADLEEKKRREAAQPDKEKLINYVNSLSGVEKPDLDTHGAELILNEAVNRLKDLCGKIIQYTETI